MKNRIFLGICLLCGLAAGTFAASDAVKKAQAFGAHGKISLQVADTDGAAVTNANINVAFSNQRKGATVLDGISDTNGFFVATGISDGDINYTVTNAGYYRTSGRYWFYRWKEECVEDGRWIPWNPLLPVILKQIKNPIPMYARRVDIEIPEQNKPLGFDLEKGDWVAPYGGGSVADFSIAYSLQTKDVWTGIEEFDISSTNFMCGLQEVMADTFSTYISDYEAPLMGYTNRLHYILNRTKTEIIEEKVLSAANYIVFRSRAVVDGEGNLVRACYGKIYPPIKHGVVGEQARMILNYYFNPDGTRNLEFDPQQNLFGKLPSGEMVYKP